MAEHVYGITPIKAGLNNQRIALVGLIGTAWLEGAKVRLPDETFDYAPERGSKGRRSLPFESVFDAAQLREALADYAILTADAPTEVLDYDFCFRQGSRFLPYIFGGPTDAAILRDAMRSCQAAPALRALSRQALDLFGDRPPLPLQLRIERDWQNYLTAKPSRADNGDTTTDPRRIFAKIAAAGLGTDQPILACCDEDDLLHDRAELKRDARDFGLDLVFKSEIEQKLAIPSSRVQRTAIDFGICLEAERYVGLSRSSFSNMLCLVKSLDTYPVHPAHFIYNAPGDVVVLRQDYGLGADPRHSLRPPKGHKAADVAAGWRSLEIRGLRRQAEHALASARLQASAEEAQRKQAEDQSKAESTRLTQENDRRTAEEARLQQENAQLKAENTQLTPEIDRRMAEESRIRQENVRLKAEINALRKSTSWRLTAPVRALSKRFFWRGSR